MSERNKSNCSKCPVRDICSLEFDGNERPSPDQILAADYGMFQLRTVGQILDVPKKSPAQTRPWTINPHPIGLTPEQAERDAKTVAELLGPEYPVAYAEAIKVAATHPAASEVPTKLRANQPSSIHLN